MEDNVEYLQQQIKEKDEIIAKQNKDSEALKEALQKIECLEKELSKE